MAKPNPVQKSQEPETSVAETETGETQGTEEKVQTGTPVKTAKPVAEAAVTPEPVKPRPPKALNPRAMSREQSKMIPWVATVPNDTTIEDIMDPLFWKMVASSTFQGEYNEIIVYWEDKSQRAHLFVSYYDKITATVRLISHVNFGAAAPTSGTTLFDVIWGGPESKYRIIRKKDGEVVADKIDDQGVAWRRAAELAAQQ